LSNAKSASSNADKTYRRLASHTRQYIGAFLLAILANIIYAVIDGLFIEGMAPLIDEGLFKKQADFLIIAPLFVIVLISIRSLSSFVSGYLMGWVGQNVVADLRKQVFKKYMHLPAAYFDANESGNMVSRLTYNAEKVANTATNAITVIVRESGFLIYVLISMFMKSVFLSLIYLISLPLIAIVVTAATKRFQKASSGMQNAMGQITNISSEGIHGYKTVKLHGAEDQMSQQFNQSVNSFRGTFMKFILTKNLSSPLVQFISAAGLSVVLYFSLAEVQNGNLTPGTFTAMIFFMMAILRPLKQLTSINSQIQSGLIAAKTLFEVIDQDDEIDQGKVEIAQIKGDIRFENVSVQFPNRQHKTIDNISFTTKPGQVVAIVGNSGGGKSTLLNLMMRVYQPTEGCIYYDDVPISDITLKSLRNNIALVSQRVTLFNATIRDNLIFGLRRDVTDKEIQAALVKAHAVDFVAQLPNGIETIIGDDNALLSGGQQQRIAIARAILRNSSLLFLDEATSALDSKSEEQIKASLDEFMADKTTFVVAHRLSTIRNADIIILIENGQIIEQGTHQELIEKKSSYEKLYNLQFKDNE